MKGSLAQKNKGFTLVELVVILVVLAIAFPPLLLLFSNVMRHAADSETSTIAYQLAQDIMEEIKTKRWDETTPLDGGATSTPSSIGPDGGESRADYDDVDDFTAITNQSPPHDAGDAPLPDFARFTRSVGVDYVEYNEGESKFYTVLSSNYKRITVSISWEDSSIEINTIVSNY